jgi:YVTN family beta-propeller protein
VRNTSTFAFIDTINVGENPHGLAISPDGTRAFVVNQDDNTLSVINTATNTVIATIPVGSLPNEAVISADDTRVYVTIAGSDAVSVLPLV